jgi:hypothetical protein
MGSPPVLDDPSFRASHVHPFIVHDCHQQNAKAFRACVPGRPYDGSLQIGRRKNLPHDDLNVGDFFYHALYFNKSKEALLEGKGVQWMENAQKAKEPQAEFLKNLGHTFRAFPKTVENLEKLRPELYTSMSPTNMLSDFVRVPSLDS